MQKIVLYIDSMTRGGAQRVMGVLANYLSAQCEVVLINDYKPDENAAVYMVNPQIRREYLDENESNNPIIRNIQRVVKLRSILNREKPDVVLSFLGKINYRMLISSVGLQCKKIVSVRNDPNKEYGAKRLQRFVANMLFGLSDGIVFQTQEASKYFNDVNRKKSKVIYNPVSDQFYHSHGNEGFRKDVVTAGRLEVQKNHKMLIEAFSLIAEKYPDDSLIIYGEGSLRDELSRYIELMNLEGRVKLPGNIPNISDKLRDAKVFVLSSDYEGMPNALMEAMAMGIPVISTDCPSGGPQELFQSKLPEYLVPCRDTKKLSAALELLLGNDAERKRNSVTARELAEGFREDQICSIWNSYIEDVIGNER